MKIYIFTIRDKQTNELIFAEGARDSEYFSHFKLDKKWLEEIEVQGSWGISVGKYYFDEEVRHLMNADYKNIVFNLEEIDFK